MRLYFRTALLAGLAAFTAANARADDQFDRYYEEDAWYDVTEWFDDNDYNPAEEAIADEDFADAGEADEYGYLADSDDRWFYDYYDYRYSDWGDLNNDDRYEYSSRYYDFDEDGLYEAFASFHDVDGDGAYEEMDYYSFGDPEPASADGGPDKSTGAEMAAQEQQRREAARLSFQGTVESSKQVQTPQHKHLVVRLKDAQQNRDVAVDLGPAGQISAPPEQGEMISVAGPLVKIGDRPIVMAQQIVMDGETRQIDRSPRRYEGEITSLTTTRVRGEVHQLAKIRTAQKKSLMVDLGRKDQLQIAVSEGDSVQVSGTPVRVQDRRVLLANKLTRNGETTEISRNTRPASSR